MAAADAVTPQLHCDGVSVRERMIIIRRVAYDAPLSGIYGAWMEAQGDGEN